MYRDVFFGAGSKFCKTGLISDESHMILLEAGCVYVCAHTHMHAHVFVFA